MNIHTLKLKLSQRLEKKLPGVSSQNIMLITPQSSVKYFIPPDNIVLSAVLILLFPICEDIHFFLTKRTDTVQYHKGQISLPGGAKEEGENEGEEQKERERMRQKEREREIEENRQ